MTQTQNAAHRRLNPLNGEWVTVSPHRNNRPWLGATEVVNETELPHFDATCPLCPGNKRANGVVNADYKHTFVFQNDFAALTEVSEEPANLHPLFTSSAATGIAKVICFSPEHNKTLARMGLDEIAEVVSTWKREYEDISRHYACVHIFENKGEIMGCSQPHPHGQIWAHQHYSTEIEKENSRFLSYYQAHGVNLLEDYIKQEQKHAERIVFENEAWIVLVPYWAKWPFETLLISKHDIRDFSDLSESQITGLAEALNILTIKYDNVFNCSFPYSMGWHNAPSDLEDKAHWRLHAHFYPPLLRSASVKKHMVGYEMLGESQRDLTAEQAAKIIREVSNVHYKERSE